MLTSLNRRPVYRRLARSVLGRRQHLPESTYAKAQLNCDSSGQANGDVAPTASARWFSELQARLQHLRSRARSPRFVEEADQLLQRTNTQWIQLLAGSQGFLTEPKWRGLDNHQLFWGDMDSMGHINNVMYNRYVETGRVQFFRTHGQDSAAGEKKEWEDLVTPQGLGLILKTITTEFKFPMKFPDRIHVLYKLSEPPTYDTTSLNLEAWILSDQHRRIAARSLDETAIYDYAAGNKSVLKPFMVEKLQETFLMQERARIRFQGEARQVIADVEKLEAEIK
ncbi:thioesterase-like superfamily-domain-containing protein [Colletotrichum cereale]|nr:thioesterase-like superfamily-domain-containing protein [Colletotrichum cereale]